MTPRARILARKRDALVQLCALQREDLSEQWQSLGAPVRAANVVHWAWDALKRHPLVAVGIVTALFGRRSRTAVALASAVRTAQSALRVYQGLRGGLR
jgi:hypothetical protein